MADDTTPPSKSTTTVDQPVVSAISSVHSDILHHILTRLDGPSLASAACASSQLHLLSTEEKIWREISFATWPSIDDARVRHVISTFPSGYRSFYSDVFPLLDHRSPPSSNPSRSFLPPSELISAVDVHYKKNLIFSKVQQQSETSNTDWFFSYPFRVDLLDPKEYVFTPIRSNQNEDLLKHLNENVTLNWVVIDPTRKRAANVSSRKPVSVQRHWLTGDIQLRYVTVMAGYGNQGSSSEMLECTAVVTFGGEEGEEVHVREVSMYVEDMEGKHLNGRESLVILGEAIERGKRRKEMKERFEDYLEMKRERREKKERREKAFDMFCIVIGVGLFLGFWSFILFR